MDYSGVLGISCNLPFAHLSVVREVMDVSRSQLFAFVCLVGVVSVESVCSSVNKLILHEQVRREQHAYTHDPLSATQLSWG